MTPLIDVRELIEKFSIVELNDSAERYWQRLVDNPRLQAKPYNLGDAEHILPQLGFLVQGLYLFPGMTVLDFGAGSCYASRILNQLGLRVISVDVSKTALEIGRSVSQQHPPFGDVPEHIFSLFDGKRLDVPDESVDRIFCLDAFHHVSDQHAVLREMGRVLKDGGIAGFAEPGPHHSRACESQLEMRNYRVIENDIVLTDILEQGRSCGFTDLKVSISTIHPPLVPLQDVSNFLSQPTAFLNPLRDRISNYPIFFLYKGDPTINDSRASSGLKCFLRPRQQRILAHRREPVKIVVDVQNTSAKTWLPSGVKPGCVNLGAILHHDTAHLNLDTGKEYRLSVSTAEVKPGVHVDGLELDLGNLEPGEYVLDIDLVSEHVCWFQSQSDSLRQVHIRVVED